MDKIMMGSRTKAGLLTLSIIGMISGIVLVAALAANALRSGPPATRVVTIHGSLAHVYSSVSELKADSRLVAAVTVLAQTPLARNNTLYTRSTVRLDQILWSSSQRPPSTAVVWQLGGRVADGRTMYQLEGFPVFAPGARYVLFLTDPAPQPGEYWTTGAFQGAFTLDASGYVNSYSGESAQTGVYIHQVPLAAFAHSVQAG